MDYFYCFVIGAFVSFVELYSRYDKPLKIITTFSSIVHIAVNGGVSILTYKIIEDNGYLAEYTGISKILIASTASLLILRSSFANVKLKGESFDAGISSIIQVLLRTCERAFDRERNREDLNRIEKIMTAVVFEKAYLDLPLVCLEKMGSVTAEEYNQIGKDIAKLHQEATNIKKTKSVVLGAKISKLTGMDVLEKGVSLLRPEIETDDTAETAASLKSKIEELGKRINP